MVTFEQMTTEKFRFVALGILHTITPSRIRFQSRSGWVFCCKWSKTDWMSMNGETTRTGIRVREAEKAYSIRVYSQGRGAKKKGPDCIRIRVLLWCRWWDSFAAVDIGLSCLRYALRIPPCRKPASLQNTALRCFAVAQSSPFLQTAIEKTTRRGWSFLWCS